MEILVAWRILLFENNSSLLTMTTHNNLPEEVLTIIGDKSEIAYPGKSWAESHMRIGFEEGATAALTDPSIYEAAGLVKRLSDAETASAISKRTLAIVFAREEIKELKDKLTTAHARIKELEEREEQRKIGNKNST